MQIKKILIVEDELLIAKVFKLQLEKLGYSIELAADDIKAIEKVKELTPDLIIMDVYLKNNSFGINVSKDLRSMGYKMPIVFTTGNSYEATLDEIEGIENVELLIKPVSIEQLQNVISKLN